MLESVNKIMNNKIGYCVVWGTIGFITSISLENDYIFVVGSLETLKVRKLAG